MRKLVIVFLTFGALTVQDLKAQCDPLDIQPPKIKFSGVAPAPWSINGLANDWQTILGPATGNNSFPYNPALPLFNFSMDPHPNLGAVDLDSPEPPMDLRLAAFTHDDYNVYFYLRRLVKSNAPNAFYYFCDINADGFMNTGEPVFGGQFNLQNITDLSVYSFVPNLNVDHVAGKGNWMESPVNGLVDGYTINGSVQKIFGANSVPVGFALAPHEVFKAEMTENGYGIEFAIPWRYFRNWVTPSTPLAPNDIFTYHIAQQKGAPPAYLPQMVKDNFGSCCKKLLVSGTPQFNITSTNVTTLVSGLSYRVEVTLQNLSNVAGRFGINTVSFSNIQLNSGLSFSPDAFSVMVNGAGFAYSSGTYIAQPITYIFPDLLDNSVTVNAFGSTTFTVDINLPANHSVSQVSVGLNFTDGRFSLNLAPFIYCGGLTGGGKGINPVGFDIEPDPEPESGKGVPEENERKTPEKPGSNLIIYPNPSKGSATIVLPADTYGGEVRLEDLFGRIIHRSVNVTGATIKLQNLRPGMYVLRFISGNMGKQYIKKLIVQ